MKIKAIAKSVAKWVWEKDSDAETKFKKRQAVKGRKGGIAKGSANFNKKVIAKVLYDDGSSLTNIARDLDVTVMTIRRWILE